MSSQLNILPILFMLTLLFSCSKSVIVKPDDLSFKGITLYPNHTYDIVYGEHDVAGVMLNLGTYSYCGDTLVLKSDKDVYLNRLTEPEHGECEETEIRLNFKTYLSVYQESSSLDMYWFYLEVKGITNGLDTVVVWDYNSTNRQENLNQIRLKGRDLKNVEQVWVEIQNTPTTDPIHLPPDYECLDITIPVINVASAQVLDRDILSGMNEFIIEDSKRHYKVTSIQRQNVFKVKKSK